MIAQVPYPGLRPFTRHDSKFFFGREEQTDDLLRKLGRHRFLAVVGESGCGKSSLVRAGLLAALESGFMASAGARWHFATMRPGSRPIERLVACLAESGVIQNASDIGLGFLRSTLNRSPRGLVQAIAENSLSPDTSFLLLVDQFEEIFRISRREHRDQADAFVSMLLESISQTEVPIYVVITMRSDFLGDTSLFSGLPEAVNEGIYLTPRLSRQQRREVIEMPARVCGGSVEADLVNKLLNELATDRVQLPQLQHLLMRMWLAASAAATDSGPRAVAVTMQHYENVGGLARALDKHAEDIFETLNEDQRKMAKAIFDCLCERAAEGGVARNTRRPTKVEKIVEFARVGAGSARINVDDIVEVADRFRAQNCNFLTPGIEERIYPNTVLDISHESLMTSWERLHGWMDERSHLAETLQELLIPARRWARDTKEFFRKPYFRRIPPWPSGRELWWSGANFVRAKIWQRKTGKSWAILHPGDYELADRFVTASRARRRVYVISGLIPLGLLTLALTFSNFGPLPNLVAETLAENPLSLLWQLRKERVELRASTAIADELQLIGEGLLEVFEDGGACGNVWPSVIAGAPDSTDEDWGANKDGIVDKLLADPCSRDLKALVDDRPELLEIFITDERGFNVCASRKTSDFVQSDEGWWQDVDRRFRGYSKDQVVVGQVEFDTSARSWSVPVAFPLENPETTGLAGIAKAVFDFDEIKPDSAAETGSERLSEREASVRRRTQVDNRIAKFSCP